MHVRIELAKMADHLSRAVPRYLSGAQFIPQFTPFVPFGNVRMVVIGALPDEDFQGVLRNELMQNVQTVGRQSVVIAQVQNVIAAGLLQDIFPMLAHRQVAAGVHVSTILLRPGQLTVDLSRVVTGVIVRNDKFVVFKILFEGGLQRELEQLGPIASR